MEKIYLFYGEDSYTIDLKIKDLISQVSSDYDVVKYELDTTPIQDVLDDLSTPSLLSPMKIVIANDCIFLSSVSNKEIEHDIDKLLRYITNPNPESVLLLIVRGNIDERKKIVKELKKIVICIECKKLNEFELIEYVTKQFSDKDFLIEKKDVLNFIQRIVTNLRIINQEIQKLMFYKMDEKKINMEDILALVPKTIEENIFALVDAVVSNEKYKIFEIYNELLRQGEEPIKIIALLASQFRLIYQTKILIKKGYMEKDIASKLEVHPYRVKLASQKSYAFSETKLESYLKHLADLDINIKVGKIDKNLGLELFFLQL